MARFGLFYLRETKKIKEAKRIKREREREEEKKEKEKDEGAKERVR